MLAKMGLKSARKRVPDPDKFNALTFSPSGAQLVNPAKRYHIDHFLARDKREARFAIASHFGTHVAENIEPGTEARWEEIVEDFIHPLFRITFEKSRGRRIGVEKAAQMLVLALSGRYLKSRDVRAALGMVWAVLVSRNLSTLSFPHADLELFGNNFAGSYSTPEDEGRLWKIATKLDEMAREYMVTSSNREAMRDVFQQQFGKDPESEVSSSPSTPREGTGDNPLGDFNRVVEQLNNRMGFFPKNHSTPANEDTSGYGTREGNMATRYGERNNNTDEEEDSSPRWRNRGNRVKPMTNHFSNAEDFFPDDRPVNPHARGDEGGNRGPNGSEITKQRGGNEENAYGGARPKIATPEQNSTRATAGSDMHSPDRAMDLSMGREAAPPVTHAPQAPQADRTMPRRLQNDARCATSWGGATYNHQNHGVWGASPDLRGTAPDGSRELWVERHDAPDYVGSGPGVYKDATMRDYATGQGISFDGDHNYITQVTNMPPGGIGSAPQLGKHNYGPTGNRPTSQHPPGVTPNIGQRPTYPTTNPSNLGPNVRLLSHGDMPPACQRFDDLGTLSSKSTSKLTQFFPKGYDGEGGPGKARGHWLKFLDFCEHHGLTESESIDMFKKTLEGNARSWHDDSPKSTSIMDLKRRFLNKFYVKSNSRTTAMQQFWNIEKREDESWGEVIGRMKVYNATLMYDERVVKDKLLDMLTPEVRVRLMSSPDMDIDTMLRLINRYEDEGADIGRTKQPSKLGRRINHIDEAQEMGERFDELGRSIIEGIGQQLKQVLTLAHPSAPRPDFGEAPNANPKEVDARPRYKNMKNVECFHCHKYGHIAKNCRSRGPAYAPQPANQNTQETTPPYVLKPDGTTQKVGYQAQTDERAEPEHNYDNVGNIKGKDFR